jgi:lysine/ornithine N-monooxygenase
VTTIHRGHPLTVARHEALRSPLPPAELGLPVTTQWLRARAELFARVAERHFRLTFDPAQYSKATGLLFAPHYVAQVYRGEPDQRWEVPLMVVNLARVLTREAADRVFAHETMHLRVPSYGHKRQAFAWAQQALDRVGALTA